MLDKTKDEPDLLAPTATERRAMLIAGAADFIAHEPTPEESVDEFIAKHGMPKGDGIAFDDSPAEFDWCRDPSIVLREQPETACYFNPERSLVIRQRKSWNDDEDSIVIIAEHNIMAFIDRLTDMVGIGSAGQS